ncbi:YdcF family protein [Alteromonas gracilis]|uniref:YdcF family protein n=1 Tax=Alteromonas gracilis TaxID=1479524 RepID=UPI0036F1EF57
MLMTASLILLKVKKEKIAKRLFVSGSLILFIFSQPWVANVLLYPLEHHEKLYDSSKISRGEIIFVPACYYQTRYDLPEVSRWHECSMQRLIQAKILSDELGIPIIVTGGSFLSDKNVKYSEKAKQFLEVLGVQPNRIISVPEGTDSQSEVNALKRRFNRLSIITITSATHQFRLSQILKNAHINSNVVQVDFQSSGELKPFLTSPSILALERTRRAIYEYMAIAKYYVLEK